MFRAASLLLIVLFALTGCDTIVREIVTTQFEVGYHMSRGIRYYDGKQYDAARNEFNLALEAQPDNIYCLEYRALTNIALRNYKAAIADLDRAEKIFPTTGTRVRQPVWIVSMRAMTEADAGNYAAAERDDARLVRYEPKNPWRRDNLAGRLFAQGKVAAAVAAENEAITLAPHAGSLYNDRCFYRAATSELAGALADCNVALQHPHVEGLRLHTLSSRALVYVKLGQPANAIADCNAALRIAPSDPDSLYLRGFAEEQRGDAGAARRDIAAGLARKPSMTSEYAVFRINSRS